MYLFARKAISSLLIVTITALPLNGYASNGAVAVGSEGQAYGFELTDALESAPGGLGAAM